MRTELVIAIGVLVAVQLVLQITALVQLSRTPAERVTIGGRKWAWVLIIVLGEAIGPILWFAMGRTPAPAVNGAAQVTGAERTTAVDELYGPKAQS